ncbi:MAG: IgGFc-binding protein [Deltaproteobacteria bacterium]|nr:IgGFc-binding protein [Deltaproteobacteria bacterium]
MKKPPLGALVAAIACAASYSCAGAVGGDDDGGGFSGSGRKCKTSDTCPVGEICDKSRGICVTESGGDGGISGDAGRRICNPGTRGCQANDVSICNETGMGWEKKFCKSTQTCENGACTDVSCEPGQKRCGTDGTLDVCDPEDKRWVSTSCGDRKVCVNNRCMGVICEAGEKRCAGDGSVQTCDEHGTGFKAEPCPDGEVCDIDSCKEVICTPQATKCTDARGSDKCGSACIILNTCNSRGTEWDQIQCGVGSVCDKPAGQTTFLCLSQTCVPGEKRCAGDNRSWQGCNAKGTDFDSHPCSYDQVCENAQCAAVVCTPGQVKCDPADETLTQVCNALGTGWDMKGCGPATVCIADHCVPKVCSPGYRKCDGQKVVECNADGTGFDTKETCSDPSNLGNHCAFGRCLTLCDEALQNKAYLGCEFWPADLPQGGGFNAQGAQYAVVVSNPQDKPVTATLYTPSGQVAQQSVGAKGLGTFLPSPNNIEGSGRSYTGRNSYKLTTTLPVAVYQFNPYNNAMVYSNDASLLIPTAAMGNEYYVMAKERSFAWYGDANESLSSFAVVIATQPGQTSVTVTVGGNVCSGGGIPDMAKGTTQQFALNQWDVLDFEACAQNQDMTGTYVKSDKAVAVYGGTGCSQVPTGVTACDHLEMQMFPISTWGMDFVATKYQPRGSEPDYWRIMAAYDNTQVTTTPAQPGTPKTLAKGQFFEFNSRADFEVHATQPVLVAQFMAGQDAGAGTGDPSFSITPPNEQYREDYIFLVPTNYNGGNFVNITAPAGASVQLDGANVAGFAPVGSGKYGVAKKSVGAGTHTVTADAPVGITVFGYDQYVSYAYPGGLNLIPLNE